MEYVYTALLLHSAKQPINEGNVKKVLESAGITVDDGKLRALVASLEGLDIEEAMKQASVNVAAVSAPAAKETKEEAADEDEDEKKAEDAAAGLSALFG